MEGERLTQELRLIEPLVSSRQPQTMELLLTTTGAMQRYEVVLEQTRWWRRDMGSLRALQDWRAR